MAQTIQQCRQHKCCRAECCCLETVHHHHHYCNGYQHLLANDDDNDNDDDDEDDDEDEDNGENDDDDRLDIRKQMAIIINDSNNNQDNSYINLVSSSFFSTDHHHHYHHHHPHHHHCVPFTSVPLSCDCSIQQCSKSIKYHHHNPNSKDSQCQTTTPIHTPLRLCPPTQGLTLTTTVLLLLLHSLLLSTPSKCFHWLQKELPLVPLLVLSSLHRTQSCATPPSSSASFIVVDNLKLIWRQLRPISLFAKSHLNVHKALVCAIVFGWCISMKAVNGVKIVHHNIPRMIDGTNNNVSVTLDCVYVYDPGDVKLVVRWFHNESPEPIYQWIPEPDIRYVGELIRPYFDMDYQVNGDRYAKHRSLRLHGRLPVSLSGNYSCVISSIANQDSRQGEMVVYVPPRQFKFDFIEMSSEQLALECRANNVYPQPIITFSEQFSTSTNHSFFYHRFPPVNVSLSYQPESELYSAFFQHPIQSQLSPGTIYECRLELPGTNYVRKKRIKIVFPTSYVFTQPGETNGSKSFMSVTTSGVVMLATKTGTTTLVLQIVTATCWCFQHGRHHIIATLLALLLLLITST